MTVKIILCLFFVGIFYSLGSALYYLVKGKGSDTRIVKALTIRIMLSIAMFVCLMIAFAMGWISPHPI
jgi:hypothetical protein